MTVSIIVPTKNRAKDLAVAIHSVLEQSRLPLEIIVVDQSSDRESEAAVRAELHAASLRGVSVDLQYVHDPSIAGANAARNVGMGAARGEIVALIEDDIVLDRFALERLVLAYKRHPELLGMSGVITNYRPPAPAFRTFDRIFTVGIFRDDRQPLYWGWERFAPDVVIPITQMGGLMTWRASAIVGLAFDETPKDLRVRGEDRDFCFQVSGRAGGGRRVFGMAMGSRLTHNPSPVGRYQGRLEELKVVSQHYFYSRHLRGSLLYAALYAWWNVGVTASAVVASVRRRELEPLRALLRGWRRIRTGYVRPTSAPARQPGGVYA